MGVNHSPATIYRADGIPTTLVLAIKAKDLTATKVAINQVERPTEIRVIISRAKDLSETRVTISLAEKILTIKALNQCSQVISKTEEVTNQAKEITNLVVLAIIMTRKTTTGTIVTTKKGEVITSSNSQKEAPTQIRVKLTRIIKDTRIEEKVSVGVTTIKINTSRTKEVTNKRQTPKKS